MDATMSVRPASRLLWNPESAGRSGGACDGIGDSVEDGGGDGVAEMRVGPRSSVVQVKVGGVGDSR